MRKIFLLTTSREPSYRTRSFLKDLATTLPCILMIHRGKKTLLELALIARKYGVKYIGIVGERKGNPSILKIYNTSLLTYQKNVKPWVMLVFAGLSLSRELGIYHRPINVDSMSIDSMACISDLCYRIADIFLTIFYPILSNNPDLEIVLKENDGIVKISFRTRTRKACGRIIKVRRVIANESSS